MAAVSHLRNQREARLRETAERILLRCLDGNSVSIKQFLDYLSVIGIEPDVKDMNKLERLTDEEGYIGRQEFSSYIRRSQLLREIVEAEKKSSNIDKAEIAFKALDKDNDGYIDMRELSKLAGKMDEEKVTALMNKLDTDGDGKITLDEFRGLFNNTRT